MSSLIVHQTDGFLIFNIFDWSACSCIKRQKSGGTILTFYKFKWSTIVSSEFILMRLSYVSVVKTFNAA